MRSQPSRAAGLAVAGLVAFTVWISWRAKVLEWRLDTPEEVISLLHRRAPDFTLKALDGRTLSLADFRGKRKVVVTFWASWCGPCRMETPALRAFYQKTHKDGSDFEIVAVDVDDERPAAEEYATSSKMPFPVVLDGTQRTADAYGVDSIPRIYVIDKDGMVSWGRVGYQMGLELELANQLGIKDYGPAAARPNGGTGAPNGSAGR
ncbi:MAG: TlpA family protein disulfide reductase [Acidobacteriia bacterium]|nr:TlpA family protein disulfide reductase [Terriglobia bacterium]